MQTLGPIHSMLYRAYPIRDMVFVVQENSQIPRRNVRDFKYHHYAVTSSDWL
jgi:hypothetical protein